MDDAALIEAPPLGHNLPPPDIEILRERLEEDAAGLIDRRDELLGSVARAPAEIADVDTAGKIADLIKLIAACHKNAEAARVAKKEPFLASGRLVDAVYKQITEPLEKGKKTIEARLTLYQRKAAEEERRRREAEARKQAEEAARLAAEAAAKEATLNKLPDVVAAGIADAVLDAAVSAAEIAGQAAIDADAARRQAEAKAADLSRTRGTFGSVASLRTFWDFADLDRATIDLAALRNFIPADALDKAVRAYIKANFAAGKPGKQIAGVRIFENTSTSVR